MIHVKRVLLAAIAAVLSVNLYTGAPLLAVWVGAKTSSATQLTMGTVGLVIVVLVATVAVLVMLLGRVGAAYDGLSGVRGPRRRDTWLRSMRDERDEDVRSKGLTGFERSLVIVTVIAVVAFEGWFFFLSGSPIG